MPRYLVLLYWQGSLGGIGKEPSEKVFPKVQEHADDPEARREINLAVARILVGGGRGNPSCFKSATGRIYREGEDDSLKPRVKLDRGKARELLKEHKKKAAT